MNTLTYGVTTLTLPDDLGWPDEYTWQPVEQRSEYSLTGSLIVEAAAKQAGRPITLAATDTAAWMSRADVGQIAAWVALAGITLTLALRGATYSVIFDHQRGAMTATPLVDYSDPDATDHYVVELRFLKV